MFTGNSGKENDDIDDTPNVDADKYNDNKGDHCEGVENVGGDEGDEGDEDDEDDEGEDGQWKEVVSEIDTYITCLFCDKYFNTMAVVLEHCKTHHNFNLSELKAKYSMDCYSYICMINFVRSKAVSSEILLSFNEPPWLAGEYLLPVIQDDPWLMFDFDGFETTVDSESIPLAPCYHVINSENGLVTLTEQHYAQLQHKLKLLTAKLQDKNEALDLAAEQINKMKRVIHSLVNSDSLETQNDNKVESKIKTIGDIGYFGSYSHFGIHYEMLSDKVRTTVYRNAIMNNAALISGKIVLDVGCGTGILSMFAASAGASKVYGIDNADIIFNAMDILRENNLSDKVDLIHGKVEEALLPVDKVDVIVSEWMGYFLLFEGMLDSIIMARKRFLKTDGVILPNRCVLYIMGVSDLDTYKNTLDFWFDVYGFKMSCLVEEVIHEAQIFHVPEETIATTAASILDLDLYTMDINRINFEVDFCLESVTEGVMTGLCGYFDAFFDLPFPEILSTAPKSQKTHWKQTIFFLKNPILLTKGCLVSGKISCRKAEEDNRGLIITITLSDQKNDYYLL